MKQKFRLQDPGEGIHEVDVLEILVAEGDDVSDGQDILVVESDKAAVELPSPYSGRIEEIHVTAGDTVEVGSVLVVIEDGEGGSEAPADDGTDETASQGNGAAAAQNGNGTGTDGEKDTSPGAEADETAKPASSEDDRPDTSPALSAGSRDKEARQDPSESSPKDDGDTQRDDDKAAPKASPAARQAAKDAGLDLAKIRPSGSDGQITVEDVKAAAKNGDEAEKQSDRDDFGHVKRHALRSIRAATARAMARSWREIPHAVHHDGVDITEMERWRRKQTEEGGGVSLTAIVVKAMATLLPDEPRFNASFDADARKIVERCYCNINVAVATERGLVTPVIAEADRKSVSEIHDEIADLSEKARARSLTKSDLSGGTFTISNVGSLGGRDLVPIINPPQTAILGLARATLQPVVTSGLDEAASPVIEARMILPVALSFDHRALDGADAARLAGSLAKLLGDPATFTLEI